MDFDLLKKRINDGERLALRYKNGKTVFSYGPPLSLYPLLLKQHPDVDYWTEKDGATPLFHVTSIKQFDYLVKYGFDIYATCKDGCGIHDSLPTKFFQNLSVEALKKFKGGGKAFTSYLKERINEDFGGSKTFLSQKFQGNHPELENESVHTPHSVDHSWVFSTDAHNTFKTFTTEEGYKMLEDLAEKIDPVLKMLRDTPGFNEKEGFRIYTEKENLKSGATWSDDEYANPSFLYWYCLIKAVQRFPETVEMMNAAIELKVLEQYRDKSVKNATIVSLGGGCSHELLAVKAVFTKHFPHVNLRLISLDYEPLWGKIVKPLGIEFDTIDFNDPIEKIEEQLNVYNADFYVMSFVYRTYIKHKHEAFIKYLCKNSFGIFVNDRNTEYLSFGMMTYNLSKDGFLTLISDEFEGYPYVKQLTDKGFPKPIYKDTPWVKPGAVRTSGSEKLKKQ